MSSYTYCPAYDDEMRNLMDQLHNNWSFSRIYGGGETPASGRTCISDVPNLSRVPQGAQLYLVVHGHGEMPLFVASQVFDGASDKKKRFWSAAEMAEQMIGEGLTIERFLPGRRASDLWQSRYFMFESVQPG